MDKIQLLWVRAKKIIFYAAIGLLFAAWLIISGVSLSCALTLACVSDATSWWGLVVTIVSLPLIAFELYRLRETIQESIWSPEFNIGIVSGPLFESASENSTSTFDEGLPTKITIDIDNYIAKGRDGVLLASEDNEKLMSLAEIVIQNRGKKAARYVKIQLHFVSVPPDIDPIIRIDGFDLTSAKEVFVFRSGQDWILYPHDNEKFILLITTQYVKYPYSAPIYQEYKRRLQGVISVSDEVEFELFTMTSYALGEYSIECTVWAEGIDAPVTEMLKITIIDSGRETRLQKYDLLEEKFYEDHAEIIAQRQAVTPPVNQPHPPQDIEESLK